MCFESVSEQILAPALQVYCLVTLSRCHCEGNPHRLRQLSHLGTYYTWTSDFERAPFLKFAGPGTRDDCATRLRTEHGEGRQDRLAMGVVTS